MTGPERERTCADVQAVAAELALGTLAVEDRAPTLAHLAACVECRALVDDLAETADTLLLLAPEIEPPLGFEAGVAGRVGVGGTIEGAAGRARRGRPGARRVVAALVAALALVVGLGVGFAVGDSRRSQGNEVAIAQLRAPGGTRMGSVFAYRGAPRWMVMNVDAPVAGRYQCEARLADGRRVPLGWVDVSNGHGSWWHVLDTKAGVREVALIAPDGTRAATASF